MTELREFDDATPRVRDVMTTSVAVAQSGDPLAFAGQLLMWRGVRYVPIVDAEEHFVGLLSDRDLLAHDLEGADGARPVEDFMMTSVDTISPQASVADASGRIASGIDVLPVVDNDRLVGIVTAADILAERGRALRRKNPSTVPRASEVMHRPVLAVRRDDTLASAIEKLLDGDVRHLPVVDSNFRVVGMLSDRDVRTAVGDPRSTLASGMVKDEPLDRITVAAVMSDAPITALASASVLDVADVFLDERIGAVPVVRDDDTLLGMVSYVDVIAHFVGRRDR